MSSANAATGEVDGLLVGSSAEGDEDGLSLNSARVDFTTERTERSARRHAPRQCRRCGWSSDGALVELSLFLFLFFSLFSFS